MPVVLRPVLADREGEEVDRLQVFVDSSALRHSRSHPSSVTLAALPAAVRWTLTAMSTTADLHPRRDRRDRRSSSACRWPGCAAEDAACARRIAAIATGILALPALGRPRPTASSRSQTALERSPLGHVRAPRRAARGRLRDRPDEPRLLRLVAEVPPRVAADRPGRRRDRGVRARGSPSISRRRSGSRS